MLKGNQAKSRKRFSEALSGRPAARRTLHKSNRPQGQFFVMKFKPFLITALIAVVAIAIVNRVEVLKKLVYNT